MTEVKIKVTKSLYKAYDSYERRQLWVLKEMLESMKGNFFSISGSKELYGLAETNKIQKR